MAAWIVRRVQDTEDRQGLRHFESTLLEDVTEAPDSDGGSELGISREVYAIGTTGG